MIGPNIPILLLPHYLLTHELSSSLLLSTPPHVDPAPPPPLPTHTTEAVVLFEFTKKHDDELSLKMGDVITNVEQVCEPHCIIIPQNYHTWSNTRAHKNRRLE